MKHSCTSALFVLLAASAYSAEATRFSVDPAPSVLEFSAVQAGAEFKGNFQKFTAAVDFAPDALPSSKIDVQIDLASEDSKDKDRDKTIKGADIFDVAHFPTARYVTKTITKNGDGFIAQGTLTLRGVTKDIPIDFRFSKNSVNSKLDGTATLNRLDFGVGQGDWKSTEWIGNQVRVRFSLVLKPNP